MDPKKVGHFICTLRLEKKLTQNELADKIHVTNKAISRWERGVGLPDITLFEPLSKELGVSIQDLMNGEYSNYHDEISQKNNNLIKTCIFVTVLLLLFILYFFKRYHNPSNSYVFLLKNNLALIPFANIYLAIINKSYILLIKNVFINLVISLPLSFYLSAVIKFKNKYVKSVILINIAIEILKWITLIGIFDINDIIIRISVGILIISRKEYKNND